MAILPFHRLFRLGSSGSLPRYSASLGYLPWGTRGRGVLRARGELESQRQLDHLCGRDLPGAEHIGFLGTVLRGVISRASGLEAGAEPKAGGGSGSNSPS